MIKINLSSGGASVKPDYSLHDLHKAICTESKKIEVVVLPGGVGVHSNVCDMLKNDGEKHAQFSEILDRASHVLTICTGSFIIASLFKSIEICSIDSVDTQTSDEGLYLSIILVRLFYKRSYQRIFVIVAMLWIDDLPFRILVAVGDSKLEVNSGLELSTYWRHIDTLKSMVSK